MCASSNSAALQSHCRASLLFNHRRSRRHRRGGSPQGAGHDGVRGTLAGPSRRSAALALLPSPAVFASGMSTPPTTIERTDRAQAPKFGSRADVESAVRRACRRRVLRTSTARRLSARACWLMRCLPRRLRNQCSGSGPRPAPTWSRATTAPPARGWVPNRAMRPPGTDSPARSVFSPAHVATLSALSRSHRDTAPVPMPHLQRLVATAFFARSAFRYLAARTDT